MTEIETQDFPAALPLKVYFEAGANDGRFQSRTWQYRDDNGWVGVLVEPDPRCHADLIKDRSNTHTSIFKCALVSNDSVKEVGLYLHHHPAMNMTENSDQLLVEGKGLTAIRVPCRTIQSIFDELGLDTIDELYLDIEGYEVEALRGIKNLNIKFAEIELHAHTPEMFEKHKKEMIAEMSRFGLVLTYINCDEGNPKLNFKPASQ